MSVHAWCRDIPRDEAVRAAEDGRSSPLPTLEEAISTITQKGDSMATKAEIQQAAYRAEASEQPAPAEPATSGLRTERVTLEIKHFDDNDGDSVYRWNWAEMMAQQGLGINESVRVVEEVHFDDLANMSLERDAAIRERDRIRENAKAEHNIAKAALDERDAAIRERDEAKARVEVLIRQRDLFRKQLESAPAASGAAGTEADYYVVTNDLGMVVHISKTAMKDGWAGCTITPLFAAPQSARGGLTEKERHWINYCRNNYPIPYAALACFDTLLARSSPPEVVLTAVSSYENAPGNRVLAACDVISAIRKAGCEVVTPSHWQIAAAGVTCKEVGK